MVSTDDVAEQDRSLIADVAMGLKRYGEALQVELTFATFSSSEETTRGKGEPEPVVRAFFSSRAEAQAAQAGIDGRLFGGRVIKASYST